MEHQAFYLTEATVELAKERGACLHSAHTRYGKGVFPWELRAKGVNELADFAPELDWETLRGNMKQYGVRNATLMAIAPVESSSVVIDSTNGIEMPMSLISVKESKAGSFVQVVPEYHRLKNKYQMMWDQKDCDGYLKTAAVLAAYVDQSISTNTFYNPAHWADRKVPTTLIIKNLMQAHMWGSTFVADGKVYVGDEDGDFVVFASDKEKKIHDEGLVTVLKQIHDDLDAAVFEAYGWGDLGRGDIPVAQLDGAPVTRDRNVAPPLPFADRLARKDETAAALEQELLTRLVALNHERAAEEKRGLIRWLRPEYQRGGDLRSPTPTEETPNLPGTEEPLSQSKINNQQPVRRSLGEVGSTIVNRVPWPPGLAA
jgi:hypothetical protein